MAIILIVATLWTFDVIINRQLQLVAENKMPHAVVISSFTRFLFSFTWISNLVAVIAYFIFFFKKENKTAQKLAFVATTLITITFLVYWALIFPDSIKRHSNVPKLINSTLLHLVNPVIAIFLLFFNKKDIFIDKKTAWLTFLPIVAYYLFALSMYFIGLKAMEGVEETSQNFINYDLVIYSFLNFKHPLFYYGDKTILVIILNLVMVLIAFLLAPGIAFLYKKLSNINFKNEK
ncbi:MAGa3780 family membrane protein [[Mycoplasma] gypis]|uniref:Integral membrane protein n=1 Tax=[Mycoplasma] gypis TaxID=92404 RepID=A0ABZ2RQ15_9BACT|nr:hypothetical protein [[Mycoplasma] gypis]MBN0919544.1 hypothetical protein [[Mycoplasma] gypis]